MIYEGFLAVKSILENPNRVIDKLYLQEDKFSKPINYCRALAHQRQVEIHILNREQLNELASGSSHGGILLEADVLTHKLETIPKVGYWAFVEGIEDPYNIGYILRTLYCAGYEGLMTLDRDFSMVDSIIVKASAGASEKIEWIMAKDSFQVLNEFKSLGHQIIVSHRSSVSKPYYSIDFASPHILCIGGEKRGLSKPVLDLADQWCTIEYENKDARIALNAVSATAVLAFEMGRQKGR